MAWAPATAIRPADAASEKSRSRRDGTWKEWTTRTEISKEAQRVVDGGDDVGRRQGVEEPREGSDGAGRHHDLHPARRAARVRCEKTVPAATRTTATPAVRRATSPTDAHAAIDSQDRCQAGDPQADRSSPGARAGWPGGPRREPSCRGGAATARHGTEPVDAPHCARSSTGARTGPGGSRVRRSTGAPRVEQLYHRAERALGHPFGLFGVVGQIDGDGHRSGRGLLQLSHHELPGVRRRPPVDDAPAVTRDVGARSTWQPHVGPRLVPDLTDVLLRARRRWPGAPTTGCDMEGGRERQPHPPRPPLHRERRGGGDVQGHRVVHPAPDGHHDHPVIDRPLLTSRSDEHLVARRVDRVEPAGASRRRRGSPPATRRRRRQECCGPRGGPAVTTSHGPSTPMHSAPNTRSPRSCTQPEPPLWATSHQMAMIMTATRIGATGPGRPRPTAHGLGDGVVSRIPRTSDADCPMLSSPSTVRRRCDRQATATAFTSSGTTKLLDERTAWAWADRISQMAARGLAPRCTPGAVRVARQISTVYSATD